MKGKRLKHEDVQKEFAEQGCQLLEEYRNNYTPMKYRCSCGNESVIRLFAFRKGQRCRKCSSNGGPDHYRWNPDRDEVALNRRLNQRCKWLLKYCLDNLGKQKMHPKKYLLGYSPADLKRHLATFPNWKQLQKEKWHIDHIFPVKAFLDHGIDDLKLINCLENLRPISARVNLSKNCKYDKAAFLKWLDHMKLRRENRSAS